MLLVDAGNAQLKWATLHGEDLTDFGRVAFGSDPARAMSRLVASSAKPDRVLIANVAGGQVARLFQDAFGAAAEFAATQATFAGVTCGYREPDSLGVDRWVALLAAYRAAARSVCVVDAGTALTVDVVDEVGQHLGGLILPGLHLMAQSLQQRTSDIGAIGSDASPPEGTALFGRSTQEAVTRAALLASAALVDRCVHRLRAATHQPLLVITGGDGEALLPWLESRGQFDPHLVLKGLAIVAGAEHPEAA